MSRTRVHGLAAVAWLTVVWVLLWGTVSVANVLGGLVVAVLVRRWLPLPEVPTEGRVRPLPLLRVTWRVLVDLVVSSVQVLVLAVRPGPPVHASIASLELSTRSDLVFAMVVNVLNLQPGTLVVDIDRGDRRLYVHVLHMGQPDPVLAMREAARTIERLLDETFAAPQHLEELR